MIPRGEGGLAWDRRYARGNLTTNSGVLADAPYSSRTRFENEKNTNPEELIAAPHPGCFTMALALAVQAAGAARHRGPR
jgi:lipoyl-dependent peroxiredoxin